MKSNMKEVRLYISVTSMRQGILCGDSEVNVSSAMIVCNDLIRVFLFRTYVIWVVFGMLWV